MPRKKQLNVNGHSIAHFSVEVKSVKSEHTDDFIEVINLEIHVDEDIYRYDIRKDERAPDIHATRDYLEASLERAKRDFLKVEISEYTERFCLFFIVKDIGRTQYTGYRL